MCYCGDVTARGLEAWICDGLKPLAWWNGIIPAAFHPAHNRRGTKISKRAIL